MTEPATEPRSVSVAEAIAHLRSLKPVEGQAFNTLQLQTIVDDVYHCVPLAETAERPELADVAIIDILGIVEDFGKHRARVHKRGRTETVTADDTGMLIPFTREEIMALPDPEVKRAREGRDARGRRKPLKSIDLVPDELLERRPVVVPRGYEHGGYQTRDIAASLGALVVDRPTDQEIERFRSRHFDRPTAVLTADHVHLLHWLMSNGLLAKLLLLGPAEYSLAQLFVRSFELLDVARQDAVDGVRMIASADALTVDVTDLRAAAAKASWLFPAEFARLDRVLAEVERAPDNARLRQALHSKLFNFCSWLRHSSTAAALVSVEHMSEGHLRVILSNAGLSGDEQEEKQVVAHLRERLTAFGLANDLDREIPEGLRAWRLGKLEEFLTSREARAGGDPDWAAAYAEAVADAQPELAGVNAGTQVLASV